MGSYLDETDAGTLYAVADVLIPGSEEHPPLRDIDPSGEWLERALAARADAVPLLSEILAALREDADLEQTLRGWHAEGEERFDVVANIVLGAYYLVPDARSRVGYPGQERRPAPAELAVDELSDEIFAEAMEYAGTYRDPEN